MKKKIGGKVEVAKDIESAETNKLDKLNSKYKTNVAMQGGYPTIYKIVGGKVEYYNGERTENELVSWALKSDSKRGSKSIKRSRRQRQSRRQRRN